MGVKPYRSPAFAAESDGAGGVACPAKIRAVTGSYLLNPAFGVYAVNAALDRAGSGNGSPEWLPGVANVGMSPMFDNKAPLLEVHLFDFDGDLYARHMRVALVDYLRPEMTFDDLEGLTAQMAKDSERARQTLAWERWDQSWPAGPYLSQSEQ